jgi:hypothetical protein
MRLLVRGLGVDVNQTMTSGATPLIIAAQRDNLAVVHCLVVELGADVNQAWDGDGDTPLIIAASMGNIGVVRCLVELRARIEAVDCVGNTALLESAFNGRFSTMQYLLEEAGANMDDVNNDGASVWDLLLENFEADVEDEGDHAALTDLLRVMVLRDAPLPALVALLSPEPARVVQEGARLRMRLPPYLAHRRAYVDLRCPHISLLRGVLRALIHGFERAATTEDLWATGLGTAL